MSVQRMIKDFTGVTMLAWAGYGLLLVS